jgi:glutathione S-transferase
MTTTFRLYAHPDSANGRKVLAVSEHLHLSPEIVPVNVYQGAGQDPSYLKINPLGKIPTLVEDDFTLWESNAILQYMAEKHGDYQLSSQDPKVRADISRWLFWESAHWQPAIGAILTSAVGHRLLPTHFPAPEHAPDWEHPEFVRCVNYLNSHLSKQSFLVGNTLSIADFGVAGMMTYFHFAKFPFDRFPGLSVWYDTIAALAAWKNTRSEIWK